MKPEESKSWFIRVLLIGGLIWVGRALLEYSRPHYWNPRTFLDYVAVVGTSLAFLFLSAALWGLYRLYPLPASGTQKVWLVGVVLAILASAVVGVSNFMEDALGVKAIGFMYGFGGFGTMFGLLLAAFGAFLHSEIRLRLGWFLLACILGIAFPDYGGLFVVGIALWILAWIEWNGNKEMVTRLSKFALRWGWVGAFLGGVTYLALNVAIELYFPDHWAGSPARLLGFSYADYSRLLWILSIFLLLGLTGVYVTLSNSIGWLSKIGFLLAAIGIGLEILGNIIEFWIFGIFLVPFLGEFRTGSAGSQFGYEISSYGTMFLMVGLLLFGVSCLRSTLPLRWRVLPFIIGLISATVLFFYFAELLMIHAIIFGASWVLLGYLLRRDRPALLISSD